MGPTTSTQCHSCDISSQTFPVFRHPSTLLYYCQPMIILLRNTSVYVPMLILNFNMAVLYSPKGRFDAGLMLCGCKSVCWVSPSDLQPCACLLDSRLWNDQTEVVVLYWIICGRIWEKGPYRAKCDFLLFFKPSPFQGDKSPRLPTWFVDSLGLLLHRSNARVSLLYRMVNHQSEAYNCNFWTRWNHVLAPPKPEVGVARNSFQM